MVKIPQIIRLIKKQVKDKTVPSVTQFSYDNDPYLVLVSCILSLRTKDKTTIEAAKRLFSLARMPREMLKLSVKKIQKLIYPVGFYRTKAKVISGLSKKITDDYAGRVPSSIEELLEFKGVGRKTANLVLGLGYKIPAICVDTHVHRISNRLGWVRTKSPEETEEALKKIIPRDLWIELNTILVTFGQNICLPVAPFCSKCSIKKLCRQKGVKNER
ncbi:MAG: endonuclease III [Candidatus Omnitrophica bacterium]|nr:endonuclease III [Candidatus Omnitrophota bacterium]